ncbi:GNAT family N-acetyltransferase [Actinopolymorpha sp. B9G3]|uniref:GNAT family N-acetyltransferase n=1 Tax=Actinopolymorpha sp. B9G3 TaxID=3158970 RepID=UPI0032D957C9
MAATRVLDASTVDIVESHAVELVFEYMAATQQEAGRHVPARVDQLPAGLRSECENLSAVFRPPGALLLAYDAERPAGCVGLQPRKPTGTAEVKRLYVRRSHRRDGIGRMLMGHVHELAAQRGFDRLVLDVMPTRSQVIDFYRRLGYTETEPFATESPDPMIYMETQVVPA